MYSETCLKQPSKIDKTKVLKTGGILVQVQSIAECCKNFDLQYPVIGLENIVLGLLLIDRLILALILMTVLLIG